MSDFLFHESESPGGENPGVLRHGGPVFLAGKRADGAGARPADLDFGFSYRTHSAFTGHRRETAVVGVHKELSDSFPIFTNVNIL